MRTILVADDDEDVLYLLRIALLPYGHCVVTARDGVGALAVARLNDDLDVLILDVQMSGMTGLEVARAVRTDHSISAVVIILLSAHVFDAHKAAGYAARADLYVTSPSVRQAWGAGSSRSSHPDRGPV